MATAPFGPGLSPDSVQFLAAAKSLAAGLGWRRVEGGPLVEWAPLLPAWLALGIKLGVAPLLWARATGALAAAGVSWALGAWTSRASGSWLAGYGAALVAAVSFPLWFVSAHLWSDAPFLFLALLGVLALDARRWRAAAALAALACLMRYLGVTLVAAGVLWLASQRRWRRALWYAGLSLAPLALWLGRNALLTGTATGLREPPGYTAAANISAFVHSAIDPLLPWSWPGPIKLVLTVFAGAFGWLALDRRQPGPLTLFVALYSLAVIIVSSIWGSDPLDIRLALPLSIALIAGGFVAVARAPGRVARGGLMILALVWFARALMRDTESVALYRRDGVPGFADRHWSASPTLALLRAAPPGDPLYSNAPEIAWLALERPVRLTPRAHLFYDTGARVNDLDVFVATLRHDSPATLIWFREVERPSLVARETLASRVSLRSVAALADGAIDEASPK
jgi:hypothetical protein